MKRLVPVGLVIALVVVMAGLPCTASGEPILLRLNVKPGEVYRTQTMVDQTATMKTSGTDIKMKQLIVCRNSYTVDGVESDGSIRMNCTYETLTVLISSPYSTIFYDSQMPITGNPVAGIYDAIVGARLQLKLSPTGRVLECIGLDEILERMLGFLEPEQRKAAKKELAGQFSIQSIFGGVDQYPEYPVQIGDSWNTETSIAAGYPMTIHTDCILRDSREGIHQVDVISDIVSDSTQTNPGGIETAVKLKGKQAGTLEIDSNTGWLLHSRLTQKISGEMRIVSTGEVSPITIETTVTCEPY